MEPFSKKAPELTANHHNYKRGTDSSNSASRQHNPELREIGGKHLTVMPKSRRLGILWENQEESKQVIPAELKIVGWLPVEKQNLDKVTKPARRNQCERKNTGFCVSLPIPQYSPPYLWKYCNLPRKSVLSTDLLNPEITFFLCYSQ